MQMTLIFFNDIPPHEPLLQAHSSPRPSTYMNVAYQYLLKCCIYTGLVRVLENLESPGILLWHFPGLESPGKRSLVLESPGNLLNSSKKYEVCGRQYGELTLRSWKCRG